MDELRDYVEPGSSALDGEPKSFAISALQDAARVLGAEFTVKLPPVEPDAQLIKACDRLAAIRREEIAAETDEEAQEVDDRLNPEWWRLERQIRNLPVTTLEGARAMARAAIPHMSEIDGVYDGCDIAKDFFAIRVLEFLACDVIPLHREPVVEKPEPAQPVTMSESESVGVKIAVEAAKIRTWDEHAQALAKLRADFAKDKALPPNDRRVARRLNTAAALRMAANRLEEVPA